jgi:hypothetical protein
MRTINRRLAIGGTLAAAAALAGTDTVRARAISQRGMVGGGLAQFEQGEANFSVLATRLTFPDDREEVVFGSVRWIDAASDLNLVSTQITDYGPLEVEADQGEARQIVGRMTVNGADEVPFALNVFDVGNPGEGLDSVALTVGDAVDSAIATPPADGFGFSYASAGPIVTGDVQLVELEIETIPATEAES